MGHHKRMKTLGIAVMGVAILAAALGATVLGWDAAVFLRFAGCFCLGLGILLHSRRHRAAWPVMLAWPLFLLISELVALSAQGQSVRQCCIASSIVLVVTGGLLAGWIRDRKGSHVA